MALGRALSCEYGAPSWGRPCIKLGILDEAVRGSSSETETGGTSSNQIAASPAHVNAYPYPPDEVIGGDSVLSIQKRL